MKTMNHLLAIALVFIMSSCSKETPIENKDLAETNLTGKIYQEKEETQEIFELDFRRNHVLGQLAILDYEKNKLNEKIEEGRKDLIPILELNMKNFEQFEEQLFDIQAIICHYLGLTAERLAARAAFDSEAKQKLLAMDEVLKSCGIRVSYREWGNNKVLLPGLGKTKTVGGCKMPGRDFEACDLPLNGGMHTIIVDGKLNSLIITTENGETIGKAEFIGKSKYMDGFYEYGLDIPFEANSRLSIVVSKENLKYDVPIRVSEGF